MNQPGLRIVGPTNKEVKNYYFTIEEIAYNFQIPEAWIRQHIDQLPDALYRWGNWYFSPTDYAILRNLRDE